MKKLKVEYDKKIDNLFNKNKLLQEDLHIMEDKLKDREKVNF
jgi:hypothetical protein